MVLLPTGKALVTQVATPDPLSGLALHPEIEVAPPPLSKKKPTLPVGGPANAVFEVTVAVNVTLCPVDAGFCEEVTVVVVPDLATVMVAVATPLLRPVPMLSFE